MFETELGLKVQPFRMVPDLDFFVELGSHSVAMAALRNGLAGGESFMALTGGAGVGKTTVLRRFLSEVDRRRCVVAEMVRPGLDADDLPHLIARGLGVEVDANADASAALLRFVERLGQDQRRALLAIDEAQDLPADALRQLLRLVSVQVGAMHPMQVVLVGQKVPSAVQTLKHPGEKIVVATEARLRPLGQTETRDYVMQRLARAGWTGRPVILEDATDRIHALCGGVPRRINLLANRMLHEAGLQESIEVNATFVQAVEDLRNLEMGSPAPQQSVAVPEFADRPTDETGLQELIEVNSAFMQAVEGLRDLESGSLAPRHAVAAPEFADRPTDKTDAPWVPDEVAVISHTELPPPSEPRPARAELPEDLPPFAREEAPRGSKRKVLAVIASGLLLIGAAGLWQQRAAWPALESTLALRTAGPAQTPGRAAQAVTRPAAPTAAAPDAEAVPAPWATVALMATAAHPHQKNAASPAGPRAARTPTASELFLPHGGRVEAAAASVGDPYLVPVAALAPMPWTNCNAAAQSLGLCARAPVATQTLRLAAASPCDPSRAALDLCLTR